MTSPCPTSYIGAFFSNNAFPFGSSCGVLLENNSTGPLDSLMSGMRDIQLQFCLPICLVTRCRFLSYMYKLESSTILGCHMASQMALWFLLSLYISPPFPNFPFDPQIPVSPSLHIPTTHSYLFYFSFQGRYFPTKRESKFKIK